MDVLTVLFVIELLLYVFGFFIGIPLSFLIPMFIISCVSEYITRKVV